MPAPTSEPASGSVSTIVPPQCCSSIGSAQCSACSGVPTLPMTRAMRPPRCRRTPGLAPTSISWTAQRSGVGCAEAAEVLGDAEHVPAAVVERIEARLHAGGELDLAIDELGRIAVGVDEARGEVLLSEALELAEDVLDRVAVEVLEGRLPRIARSRDLEEVELDVPKVALVVTHLLPLCRRRLTLQPSSHRSTASADRRSFLSIHSNLSIHSSLAKSAS